MKGKITMTITIGCTALILTMIMFTQFKTVDKTDITVIETMRETELRSELASWRDKYEEIEEKIEETNSKINEYEQELQNDVNTANLLQQEVKEAEGYLGYTNLQGEGIKVTLQDTEFKSITYSDLLRLVNELNAAGADAISINDERIISRTDITVVNNIKILINARRVTSPYIVKAIGDKKYLESALTVKNGYIDEIRFEEKLIDCTVEDNIFIPAYEGTYKEKQDFNYAKENKVEE